MSEPAGAAPPPGDEPPSAEVLDELLRAFSADTADQERLDRIDLSSPEVAELLTPTPRGDDAASGEEGADDHAIAADAEPVATFEPDVDQPEIEPAAAPPAEPAEEPADAPVVQFVPVEDGAVGADEPAAAEPEPSDSAPQGELDADSPRHAGADATEEESVRIAGDPFLGGGPATVLDDTADSSGPRTISIVDDGIPDTVYIGGNLEPIDASRSTVVIEDRDGGSGSTISVEAASTATKIEPRMRERRIAVKRAEGRKRLKWATAITVVVGLVVAALAVLGSGLFAIEEVRLVGVERTDAADVAAIVEDLEGTPVLRADTDAVERELEKLPWVADARVTTQFPDGATIELRERTPAAAFQGDDGDWRLVDDHGRVLEVAAEPPAGYLPISGNGFPDVKPGQFGPPGLAAAATLAGSLTPIVLARTSEITAAPDGSDLRLQFTDGVEVRFGAAEDLVQKLVRLETKLNDLGDQRVNYIDVSTNEVGQG